MLSAQSEAAQYNCRYGYDRADKQGPHEETAAFKKADHGIQRFAHLTSVTGEINFTGQAFRWQDVHDIFWDRFRFGILNGLKAKVCERCRRSTTDYFDIADLSIRRDHNLNAHRSNVNTVA